ncbi:hypothetical protein CerSpe_275940 [Prunus speciosa]
MSLHRYPIEMDDDEKTLPADKVEVDLALSAHANAQRWYELKKKQEKTVTAHEKAFNAAERNPRLQLSQERTVAIISHMHKVLWFEKFNWFISSENYLVISGRDAQQNEMIVKCYMSKGDLGGEYNNLENVQEGRAKSTQEQIDEVHIKLVEFVNSFISNYR